MKDQNKGVDWASELFEKIPSSENDCILSIQQNRSDPTPSAVQSSNAVKVNNMDWQVSSNASLPPLSTAKISIFDENTQGKVYELNQSTTSLGRAPSNDIVLQDPCVSARHCVFEKHPEGVWIRDLNSANGTFVNGQNISQILLRSGDIIRCGTTIIKFEFAIKRPRLDSLTSPDAAKGPSSQRTTPPGQIHADSGPISYEKLSTQKPKRQPKTSKNSLRTSQLLGMILLLVTALILAALALYYFSKPVLLPWLPR